MNRRLMILVTACTSAATLVGPVVPADAALPPQPHGTVSARVLLARLDVADETSTRGYSAAEFDYSYTHELDADHDGCWTRKEVAKRDHLRQYAYSVTKPCTVTGHWKSLYDDRVYGDYYPQHIQLDHLVALADAWKSGASRWTRERRAAFGNDLGYKWDLQLVTASVNQDKGDKDPAGWLPRKHVCTFVKAWIAVKYRWGLATDPAEHAALVAQLDRCGSHVDVLNPGHPDLKALAGF